MPGTIAGLLLACILGVCQAADFIVAPNGRDDNPGTMEKPLASLAGGRDAVRRKLQAGADTDIRVLFRGGRYPLLAPVVFGLEDTAPAHHTITYEAWPEETPVLSGGRQIGNWRQTDRSTWTAEVPEAKDGKWPFRCLYINDSRRTLARMPDDGSYFRVYDPDRDAPDRAFEFEDGQVRNWPKVNEANMVALINWKSCSIPIARVDTNRALVTLAGPLKCSPYCFESGRRYFIENLPEAFDAPGEWILDRNAGLLSYKPKPGEDMARAEVLAPVATQFLTVEGTDKQPVRGLIFKGLHFRHADYRLELTGHSDTQAAESVPAALTFSHAADCVFEEGEIACVGGYAVEVAPDCRDIRIEQNELRDMGAGGIKVRSGSKRITIHNNFIHDGGAVFFGGTPVLIQDSGENVVTHNEICDFNWMGICVGWSWGFQPTACHNNLIAFNHLHHLGRGVMTDIGAIYTLGISTGTVIRNNLIHHVWDSAEGYLAGGIYPDEGSSGLLIESNIVYQTSWGGLTVHYGRDNVIRNNIFAFGRSAQIHMGRAKESWEGDNWVDVTNSSMRFERNIVIYDRGDLFKRDSELTADYNLYWNTAGPVVFQTGLDLAHWQARGRNAHARVADPRFVDAAGGDFRLRPDSPALALGFTPIDTGTIGLVGLPSWVDKPKKIVRDPVIIPPFKTPVVPDSIDEDFEDTRHAQPRHTEVHGTNVDAWIRISGKAAFGGKQSLEFQDASSVKNDWDPHFFYSLKIDSGIAKESFDIRVEKGSHLSHEWRDWSVEPYIVGPSLDIHADGTLLANEKSLMVLPLGQWIHIGIECPLGKQANGSYTLSITLPGQPDIVFGNQTCDSRFSRMTWLGFSSMAKDKQVFYLDNLKLQRL